MPPLQSEQLEAADELAKACSGLRIAKYGFSIPLTNDFHQAQASFEQIMGVLKPVEEALAAYEKVRGSK